MYSSVLPYRRLCLLQYDKERFTPTAFLGLVNKLKLGVALTDEQLSVFAGAPLL